LNQERINFFEKAFSSFGVFEGSICVEIDGKLLEKNFVYF